MEGYVILGGRERPVGGWAEYEADRRAVLAESVTGGGEPRKYYGALEAAESLLRAVPKFGGAEEGTEQKPFAAQAIQELADSVASLRAAAGTPQWWEVNDRVGLPEIDLSSLAARVETAGHASPEDLKKAVDAAEFVITQNLDDGTSDVAPSYRAGELRAMIDEARRVRRELLSSAAHRDTSSGKRNVSPAELERAAVPYASRIERANASAAAYIEAAAQRLRAKLVGPTL